MIFHFWPYCLVPFGDFFFFLGGLLKQIQGAHGEVGGKIFGPRVFQVTTVFWGY